MISRQQIVFVKKFLKKQPYQDPASAGSACDEKLPILGAPRSKIGKIWKLDPFGRNLGQNDQIAKYTLLIKMMKMN